MATRGNSDQEEDPQEEEPCEHGYKCCYEGEDLAEFQCSSCGLLLKEPCTTSCCEKNYCRSFLQGRKTCPTSTCHEGFAFAYCRFLDKTIKTLPVSCNYHKDGCQWKGKVIDLNTHRDNCEFVQVSCKKCCQRVRRARLETHIARDCPERPFSCPHCHLKGTYKDITDNHIHECQCEHDHLNRENNTYEYFNNEPPQLTACQFGPVGCAAMIAAGGVAEDEHMKKEVVPHASALNRYTLELATKVDDLEKIIEEEKGKREAEEGRRKRNEKKITDLEENFNRLTSKVESLSQILNNPPDDEISPPEAPAAEDRARIDLEKRLEEKEVLINQLEQSLEASKAKDKEIEQRLLQLESNLRTRPMQGVFTTTVTMEGFASKMQNHEAWWVPIFRNEPGLVHKLTLTIWPYGQHQGLSTHVSAWLEQEPPQSHQPPAHVFVYFELLNQLADWQHIPVPCHFPINHKRYIGEICNELVPHTALDYNSDDGTLFLANDTLKFRIQIFVKTVSTSPLQSY